MKKTMFAAVLILAGFATMAAAQAADTSTELSLAVVQAERKAIVEANMDLEPQQEEKFWKTYWEYRGEISKLTDRTIAVIEEFVDAEGEFSDEQAERMIKEAMDIEKKKVTVKNKYVKKMQEILKPMQVMTFYQVENKMDAVTMYEVAAAIPVAR